MFFIVYRRFEALNNYREGKLLRRGARRRQRIYLIVPNNLPCPNPVHQSVVAAAGDGGTWHGTRWLHAPPNLLTVGGTSAGARCGRPGSR